MMESGTIRRVLDLLQAPDVVTPTERRVSRAVVLFAMALIALAASWGVAAPILSGHEASMASMGIIADNMLKWGIAAPVWLPTDAPPDPSSYYCHHPFGIFWTTTLFVALFGNSDAICRLPAVIASIATVPVVFAIGRELYRPIAGASAALAFVCLPISLSFANFNALEVPLMLWCSVGLFGWVRFRKRRARGDLVLCLFGMSMAMNTDWPAFVLALALILIELGALRWRPLPSLRALAASAWLALSAVVIGGSYLALFHHWQKLGDLLASADARAGMPINVGLSRVLDGRAYWVDLMFTPLGIAIGKVGLGLIMALALVRRRVDQMAAVAVLAMCLAQYLLFRQGAEVHVFWPHTFALFFAFSVAALVTTLAAASRGWLSRRSDILAPLVSFALVAAALGAVVRDAIPTLVWARRTGGRFNEKGAFIESDGDKTFALRQFAKAELAPHARVGMHASMRHNWSTVMSLGGRVVESVDMKRGEPLGCDVAFFDLRFVEPLDVTDLLSAYDVVLMGPYAAVREGEGFEAFSFEESEPTLLERATRYPSEPVRALEPDPFATWEVAFHYGFDAPPPDDDPTTLEHVRIAHNIARLRGDSGGAEAFRAELMSAFDARDIELKDGTRVVGVRVSAGVSPSATILVEAAHGLPSGVGIRVQSRVLDRAALALTPPDPTTRVVGAPLLIPPRAWRRGLLYSLRVRLLPRPGRERFDMAFTGFGAPRPPSGPAPFELFRYP